MPEKESPAPHGSGNGGGSRSVDNEAIHTGFVALAQGAPVSGIDWSADQRQALARVGDWFEGSGEQVFSLEGPAGSGKSAIAVELDKHLGCDVAFGTYTGKAASVLQRKGCDTADTLDALVYRRWWTCAQTHKAQGSEWAHALVIDESGAFRADRTKWLYTAITRAADVVTVIRGLR
jgi:UvrD-like helicase C-terminal domain